MEKYIILEIIPTSTSPLSGDIIQLSAIKIDGLQLIDRFDYRLVENKIQIKDLVDLIDYDKDNFIYKNSTDEILKSFKEWANDLPFLIICNNYTKNYLVNFTNKMESIFDKLNMEYSDDIIDLVISKYKLEPSNYIVDLLYESLIYESNMK
ncbi:MAG: hypothetical protein ACK5HP_03855 [Bacilli bacterium]